MDCVALRVLLSLIRGVRFGKQLVRLGADRYSERLRPSGLERRIEEFVPLAVREVDVDPYGAWFVEKKMSLWGGA